MATGNFYNKNASKVFVVTSEDEYIDTEDLRDSILYSLGNIKKPKHIEFMPETGYDNERNFSGTYLVNVYASKQYKDYSIGVEIKGLVRSGYYEATNLDMEDTIYEFDGYKYDSIDELLQYLDYISERQKENISNWLEATEDKIKSIIEKAYARNSESYKVIAQFSNGETIYTK